MSLGQRILFFFSLLVLCFPSVSGQENLSQSANVSNDPDIAIDSTGRTVVVWTEEDWPIPDIGEIFYSVLIDGFWSPGTETFSQLYDADSPGLCLDETGLFHLIYADGKDLSSRDIFHRHLNPDDGFWSNVERTLPHVKDASNPRIEVSEAGTVFAIWEQVVAHDNQIKIVMNSKKEGQPWGNSWENVSINTNTKTAFPSFKEKNEIIYACWMDDRNGAWDIFYSDRVFGFWGFPEGLDGQEEKFHPALSLDNSGSVHILFSTGSGNIFHVRRMAQNWSLPQLVSSTALAESSLDMQSFPNNTLHAVWTEDTLTGSSLFYSRTAADGAWQQPFKIADGTATERPRIACDPEARAHVVWADTGINGKTDIYYLQVIPPDPQPQAQMSLSASEGIVPFSVSFDASLSSTPQGEMASYWWDFGDGSDMAQGLRVTHAYDTAGAFIARLYVTDSQLNVGSASRDIQILAGPFPPLDVTVQRIENKTLFYREEINSITWAENPKNLDFSPVTQYNVYRRLKTQGPDYFSQIGQVDAGTYVYTDRQFDSPDEISLYAYAVSAVDTLGREGPKAEATPLSVGDQKPRGEVIRRN